MRSAVAYEGPAEKAIHRLKYEGWRRLSRPLSRLLAERLVVEGMAARWVVSVPLHRDRLQQRGFNQSELIAAELRKILSLDAPNGELVRTRSTPPQVGKDRRTRFDNVKGAFAWRGPALHGDPILLVDDVATTGATLNACAVALNEAGSGPVTGVSIARVTV